MRPYLPVLIALLHGLPAGPAAADGPLARSIAREAQRMADAPAARAEAPEGAVALRWSELSAVIFGARVTVHLRDGRSSSGDVVAVRDTALVLALPRKGGSIGQGTGGIEIDRALIQTIDLRKTTGKWGRKLGTTLGMWSGVTIGAYVAGTTTDSAGPGIATFLAITSGMTVAGYYAGRPLDTQTTTIRVLD